MKQFVEHSFYCGLRDFKKERKSYSDEEYGHPET